MGARTQTGMRSDPGEHSVQPPLSSAAPKTAAATSTTAMTYSCAERRNGCIRFHPWGRCRERIRDRQPDPSPSPTRRRRKGNARQQKQSCSCGESPLARDVTSPAIGSRSIRSAWVNPLLLKTSGKPSRRLDDGDPLPIPNSLSAVVATEPSKIATGGRGQAGNPPIPVGAPNGSERCDWWCRQGAGPPIAIFRM